MIITNFTLDGTTYMLKQPLELQPQFKEGYCELIDEHLGIYIVAPTEEQLQTDYESTLAMMFSIYAGSMDFELNDTSLKVKNKLLEMVDCP